VETEIGECEQVLQEMLYPSAERGPAGQLALRGGKILSAVMGSGDRRRCSGFHGPDRLVSYAGLVPVARGERRLETERAVPAGL